MAGDRQTDRFTCLIVYGDGRVLYEGQSFVTIKGSQNTKIEAEKIQALVTAFEDADFFKLQDNYRANAFDLPSVEISITIHGRSKKIMHYGSLMCDGDLDTAPQELCDLEIIIDKLVNSRQWVSPK